jgi:outer membrane immunogenic protein
MKRAILTAIGLLALGAAPMMAADIPVRGPSPVMAPPVVTTNWTGCYIGAGGGYGTWNQDHHIETDPGAVRLTPTATAGGRGWFGTVQGGCDYQFAGRWVVGVFGDYDFARIKGEFNPVGTLFTGTETLRDSWAVGGRVGYVIFPQLLGFVSGGYTQARFGSVDLRAPGIAVIGGAVIPAPAFTMAEQKYSGWFLGTGYEYQLDFLPGLFWKTEYRYAQYDREQVPVFFTNGAPTGLAISAEKQVQTIRSELVYRFNFGPGPVVARY